MVGLNWKEIDSLNKKVERLLPSDSSRLVRPVCWRGRQVVETKKWREILDFRREQVFKYIPSDFIHSLFLGYFDSNDAATTDKIKQWKQDYFLFMEYTKNPEYGRSLCRRCLLYCGKEGFDATGVKSLVVSLLHEYVQDYHEELPEDDNCSLGFPCAVNDRFCCPYTKNEHFNDSELVRIGMMVNDIISALERARTLAASSRVRVRTMHDVVSVITDAQLLKALLDQYPAPHLSEGYK